MAAKTHHCLLVLLLISTIIQAIKSSSSSSSTSHSIKINLTHSRQLSRSPPPQHLNFSSESNFDDLEALIRQSIARSKYFLNRINMTRHNNTDHYQENRNFQPEIVPVGMGVYLMTFSIGSPDREFLGIADTGSDLVWLQCQPCKRCYQQDEPIFNPNTSSSYKVVSCKSKICKYLLDQGATHQCSKVHDKHKSYCDYQYGYGSGYTSGVMAMEKITFSSPSISGLFEKKIAIGCGYKNDGFFPTQGSGIVGLGGGPLSLISQLRYTIKGFFSYCFSPLDQNSTSWLILGRTRRPMLSATENTVSIPLLLKEPSTFYFVNLYRISIIADVTGEGGEENNSFTRNNKTFILNSVNGFTDDEADIVIDSGTRLTILNEKVYYKLEGVVRENIHWNPIQINPREQKDDFNILCYNRTELSSNHVKIPDMILHFNGDGPDGDVRLTETNTFFAIAEDVTCLAIIPSNDIAILGNTAQTNFIVEYDLDGREVSFTRASCHEY